MKKNVESPRRTYFPFSPSVSTVRPAMKNPDFRLTCYRFEEMRTATTLVNPAITEVAQYHLRTRTDQSSERIQR